MNYYDLSIVRWVLVLTPLYEKYLTSNLNCAYVPVKSKLQHPPRQPPRQPPGHLKFWKISVQIPPSPSQIAVQMPPPRGNKPLILFYIVFKRYTILYGDQNCSVLE